LFVMFCRSLFFLLLFFVWPFYCLSFFGLRILITPLIYSIFSLSFKGPKTTTPNELLDIGHWELLVFGNSCKSSFTCR
jgi:hypothetical protein